MENADAVIDIMTQKLNQVSKREDEIQSSFLGRDAPDGLCGLMR
jgi:hypothetical protein